MSNDRRTSDSRFRRVVACAAALVTVAATMSMTGCAMVASWPAIGDDTAINDPNVSPMPKVIAAGVREVIRRYPAQGEFIINLPEGLERPRAERIAREVGPEARVVGYSDVALPVYHVTRVWVRGDRARVDVVRPLGVPRMWQRITVHLKHTLEGWQPEYTKVWPLGMDTPGSLYGWLDAGAIGDPPVEPAPGETYQPSQETFPDQGLMQSIEVKEGEPDGSGN